jgi:hypothetical protein
MKPRQLVLTFASVTLFSGTSAAATFDHLSHLKAHAAVCFSSDDILTEVALNKKNDLNTLSQMFMQKRLFFTTRRLLIRVDSVTSLGCFEFHILNNGTDDTVFWGLLKDLDDSP